jgi:hypothetical protein
MRAGLAGGGLVGSVDGADVETHGTEHLGVQRLAGQDAGFDLLVQVQTDPHRMPIENASVRWPERLSPFVPVATVHIPRQNLYTPVNMEFTKRLSMNPWHCICRGARRSCTRRWVHRRPWP